MPCGTLLQTGSYSMTSTRDAERHPFFEAKIRLFGTWDVQSLGSEVHGLPQLSAILKLDVLGEHGGRVVFVFDPPCRVVHAQHLFA